MGLSDRWFKNACIYGIDVARFYDGNGDGIGDFVGLTARLDYLSRLGITCVWLLPFFPTPDRDNGYDVSDHYAVNPALGTLGDFVEFLREAQARGIRVLIDLVVNHTSDEHPWFREARRDPASPYRDFYVWSDHPVPVPPGMGPIFPGVEDSVWTWDEVAGAYYYHRFYDFEPGLRLANPAVREAIRRIMGFWLQLGVDGFRLDAASHMIERKGLEEAEPDDPHGVLREFRRFAEHRRGDVVLLAESDVPADRVREYFGRGDEMHLLLNFLLDNYLFLAFARQSAEPVQYALKFLLPVPEGGQWANFLRNLDELDLERLSDVQREEVYRAFGPDESMRIYHRGIRRRLAPMLRGERRRIELAFSLLFALPGAPVVVYGDEIGMGDDLDQPERESVRPPMQWTDGPQAGFTTDPHGVLARRVVHAGRYGAKRVNVRSQVADPDSLFHWMTRLIRVRREAPEIGCGACTVLETGDGAVLAHRMAWQGRDLLLVHNVSAMPRRVTLELCPDAAERALPVFEDGESRLVGRSGRVELRPWGYLWLRLAPLL